MYVLVHPDILKIEKPYWYRIDETTKHLAYLRPGVIVRVELHGRRIRGWVVDISESTPVDIKNADSIKNIVDIVSIGTTEHLLEISNELAKRYLVSPVVFYRKFSPTKNLSPEKYDYRDHIPRNSNIEHLYLVDPRADRRDLIKKNISDVGSTIVISPQNHQKLKEYIENLGHKVVIYGSSSQDRNIAFEKILSDENVVVIGNRSALFAPLTNCRSIVVLDDSYEQMKEERSPKFHILDCARLYSGMLGVSVTLITSVPSVYSYKMPITRLKEDKRWPTVSIHDARGDDPAFGEFPPEILDSIRSSIDNELNSVVIVNNISNSKVNICAKCTTIASCPQCGRNLVVTAQEIGVFDCNYCDYSRPEICENCNGTKFKKFRKGTRTISAEVQKLFPKCNVKEITSSTADSEIVQAIEENDSNVFVATTSVFYRNYLHQKIGNIVFLQFDGALFLPTIDAFNACLVSLNSALRMLKKTNNLHPIILSTKTPDHELIQDIAKLDFESNNQRDLELREKLQLAPVFATVELKLDERAAEKLISAIDHKYFVGKTSTGDTASVMFRAQSHFDLSNGVYKQIRKIAVNAKISISVDDYD